MITGRRARALAEPNDRSIAQEVCAEAADRWTGTGTDLRAVLALGGSS
ncbi:hypothetical protein [Streptomyces heilongjiangensis]|uniref:Uncharacterized protein n=1 Tax=Streptomyces heilongjiangensis TaxID=945052 RepID=A0ABW1BAP9_9ACTN|nr:hypothetical protein [Streptomyces heilongjiangensis]MDC2948471.1 hypothetical protein [Streptomyces heilongjiangensis]